MSEKKRGRPPKARTEAPASGSSAPQDQPASPKAPKAPKTVEREDLLLEAPRGLTKARAVAQQSVQLIFDTPENRDAFLRRLAGK